MNISKNNFIILFFITILNCISLSFNSDMFIGITLIANSLALCFVCRHIKDLFLLFLLILFINSTIGINIFMINSDFIPYWQKNGLLSSDMNKITANGISLMIYILLLCISVRTKFYINKFSDIRLTKSNPYIMFGLAMTLTIILLVGFFTQVYSRGNTYSSVTNPIYEYSSILMVFMFFYSKGYEEIVKYYLFIYSGFFSLFFLIIGDRSSVCIILMTLFMLYFKNKYKIKYVLAVSVFGVFLMNFIGIIRNGNFDNFVYRIIERGLYVDTITWAYYASISIASLYEYVSDSWLFAIGYLISFFSGYSNGYTNMAYYASVNFPSLYNQGGGIYSSYFYGMGGYYFVAIGSIILFLIIDFLYTSKNTYFNIYRILLVSLSFRWYLYNISTLFRGCLVITTILLLLCFCFTKMIGDHES